jgi:hypothetical protein
MRFRRANNAERAYKGSKQRVDYEAIRRLHNGGMSPQSEYSEQMHVYRVLKLTPNLEG